MTLDKIQSNKHITHILAGCALFAIVFDRILKQIAVANPDTYKPLLGNFVAWKVYFNKTLAFGIPIEWNFFFTLVASVIILGIVVLLVHNHYTHKPHGAPLLMILLGAISNIIDRVRFDAVIDYVYIMPASFINVADILVGIGALFLLWSFHQKKI